MLKLYPHCGSNRIRGLEEVDYYSGVLMNRISALLEEAQDSPLAPSSKRRKASISQEKFLARHRICWCLDLSFLSI